MGGGHGSCYLVTNGEDGETYWAYCKKYSDAFETAFKAKVRERAGGSRNVRRENSEPSRGIEITFD